MKFETPIAEIEWFDLKDIISASGESSEPWTSEAPSRADSLHEGQCVGDARDNDAWEHCV